MLPFEEALVVCWEPHQEMGISGEVRGLTIYVYEEDQKEALTTLKHEYIDCLLTRKLVLPLIAMVNTFIKLKEKEIYKEKERIITALSGMI